MIMHPWKYIMEKESQLFARFRIKNEDVGGGSGLDSVPKIFAS